MMNNTKLFKRLWSLMLLLIAMLMPQGAWAGACAYTPECASIEDMQVHLNGTNGNYNGSANNEVQASLKFNYWLDIFNYDGDNGYWAKDLTMKIDGQTLTFYTDYACTTKVSTDYSTVLHGVWGVFGDSNEDRTIGKNKSGSGNKAYFMTSSGLKGYINIYNYYAASNKWTTMKVEVFIYDLYGHKVSVCGTYKRSGKSDIAYDYVFYLGGCPRPKNVTTSQSTTKKEVTVSWQKETYSIPASDATGETRVKAYSVIDNGSWGVYRNNFSTSIQTVGNTATSAADNSASCSSSPYTYYVCYEPNATYGSNGTSLKGSETSKRGISGSSSITLDHVWSNSGSLKDAATCTAAAVYYQTCIYCGSTSDDNHTYTSGSAKGHSLTATPAKAAATCTEAGNNAYWTCSTCKKVFSNSNATTETTVAAQTIVIPHSYSDGICTACNGYETPAGNGTSSSPYLIGNQGNLLWFRDKCVSITTGDKGLYAKQTADIVYNRSADWVSMSTENSKFSGTYDGGGHTITGIKHNLTISERHFSVFGSLSATGKVMNLGLVSIDISFRYSNSDVYVGAFVSRNYGTITNCFVTGELSGYNAGSISPHNSGTISNCYSTATINTSYSKVVYQIAPTFTNCYNTSASKPSSQFKSGQICYALNGNKASGVWHQTIGTDNFPVLDSSHKVVYCLTNYRCDGTTPYYTYSNNNTGGVTDSHKMTEHAEKSATCTSDGNKLYYTCSQSFCSGKYYKDNAANTTNMYANMEEIVKPKFGHAVMEEHPFHEPTCDVDGNMLYFTCSNSCCSDKYYKDNAEYTTKTYASFAETVVEKIGHLYTYTDTDTDADELLVNPTAENAKGNWQTSGDVAIRVTGIQFSYTYETASQTVAISGDELDQVLVSCDYQIVYAGSTRNGTAKIYVELLDESKKVLETKWLLDWSGKNYEMSSPENVSMAINLSSNTRYVRMMLGGNDQKKWAGTYGPKFSNMSIKKPSLVFSKKPTCTEKGTGYSCLRCGPEKVFEIDALGHTFVEGFCSVCGEAQYDAEDLKTLLQLILSGSWTSEQLQFYNQNGDSKLSIYDLTKLVEILNKHKTESPTE